jgi:hypothetical protein
MTTNERPECPANCARGFIWLDDEGIQCEHPACPYWTGDPPLARRFDQMFATTQVPAEPRRMLKARMPPRWRRARGS